MTPLNKVFMLSSEAVLDEETLQSVLASGHSRIPVYERRNRCSAAACIGVHQGGQVPLPMLQVCHCYCQSDDLIARWAHRHAILGCILVKELAWIDKSEAVPVASLKMRSIPTLPASIALYDLLRLFRVTSKFGTLQ